MEIYFVMKFSILSESCEWIKMSFFLLLESMNEVDGNQC